MFYDFIVSGMRMPVGPPFVRMTVTKVLPENPTKGIGDALQRYYLPLIKWRREARFTQDHFFTRRSMENILSVVLLARQIHSLADLAITAA